MQMQYVVENEAQDGMNLIPYLRRNTSKGMCIFSWRQVHYSVMSKERGIFNLKGKARVKKIRLDPSSVLCLFLFSISS